MTKRSEPRGDMLASAERDARRLWTGLEIRCAAEDANSDGEMGDVAIRCATASARCERAGGRAQTGKLGKSDGGVCEVFACVRKGGTDLHADVEAILAKRKVGERRENATDFFDNPF